MSSTSSFKSIEIKHCIYRRKDCMKSYERLRDKTINFKRKNIKLLPKEQQANVCNICNKKN